MDTSLARPRWRFTGTYAFTQDLLLGLEFNPVADEVNVIGNYIAMRETPTNPMINFGSSSDRIGSPVGTQSYYVTVSKGFAAARLTAYASINYSEWERGFNLPFGVDLALSSEASLLFLNDGRRSHLMLNLKRKEVTLGLMWVWFERPGISLSWGF